MGERPPRVTGLRRVIALLAVGAAAGCLEGEVPPSPSSPPDEVGGDPKTDALSAGEVRLRLMAANITSGTQQKYEDPGMRIFRGVAPDIAMVQEMNYGANSDAAMRAFVDQAFGPGFQYYREGGAQIPNGIVSRYPIVAAGEWDDPRVGNRDFAWARIDIPGPTDLYVVSVHLLTASPAERDLEAAVLVEKLQTLPSDAYVVLGGDFNTRERIEPCVATLGQLLVTSGPHPTDHAGVDGTNASRSRPYDWVLANPALDALETPVTIGASSFADGLVVDSRVYMPLAELAPVQAGDSAASNMQHMAVVRDFAIPTQTSPPPATLVVTAPNGGESWAAGTTRDITWSAGGVSSVRIEWSADGTTWSTLTTGVAASAGRWAWAVPATATGAARVRISEAVTGQPSDASDGPFSITVAPPPGPGNGKVFVNEVLANEPGSDVAGELVEIVNGTPAAVDLSGWRISDSLRVRHTFAAGVTLAPGRALVVTGAGASTGTLALTNGGDSVTLADAAGVVVDGMSFTSSSLPARDGESMNRRPDGDPAGGFVLHGTLAPGRLASPGTRADGSAFGDPGPGDPPPPVGITAESEPNDGAASADGPVGDAVEIAGAIASASDADWFAVEVPATGRITIDLAIAGSADLDWYLYRAASPTTHVARGYTTNNPEAGGFDATAGSYLVKVVGYQGAQAGYRLNVILP
jgi:endonuclease/exonuclease/phosphatase family metal-dependent hydrolase